MVPSVVTIPSASARSWTSLPEQRTFLDGHEFPARRAEGIGIRLDALEKEVQSEAPGAPRIGGRHATGPLTTDRRWFINRWSSQMMIVIFIR